MSIEPLVPRKPSYDCLKCPAYCCSYDRIIVEKRDLARLARHFGIDVETARRRFTKVVEGEQVLRHQKDKIYGSICMFIDLKTMKILEISVGYSSQAVKASIAKYTAQ